MIGEPTTLAAAFVAGLAGSAHCLGMCGGIVASLGMGTAGKQAGALRGLGYALVYNAGRICSYSVAGAIAGSVGLLADGAVHAPAAAVALRGLTGLALIAIGAQIAFGWRLLHPLERAGLGLWRRVAPTARALMTRRGPLAALGLGALWGWLPCGLVYAMLLAAITTGDPLNAAGMMAAFGLGTAPAMIATGAAAGQLWRLRQDRRFRRAAGGVVIVLGAWTAAWPFAMQLAPTGH